MVEHLNLLLKRAHSGGHSEHTLQTLSLSLDVFLELDKTLAPQLSIDHGGGHRRPDTTVEVRELAEAIATADDGALTTEYVDLVSKGWENADWVARRLRGGALEGDDDDGDGLDLFDAMLTEHDFVDDA